MTGQSSISIRGRLPRGRSEVLGWTADSPDLMSLAYFPCYSHQSPQDPVPTAAAPVHIFLYRLPYDWKTCPNNCRLDCTESKQAGFEATPGATVPDLSWSQAERCSVAERKLICLITPRFGDSLWQTHVVMARNEHTPTNYWKRDFALFPGPVIALLWKWLRWLYYTFPPRTMCLLDQVKYMRNEVPWARIKQHLQVTLPNQGVPGIKALVWTVAFVAASFKELEFVFHHNFRETKPCRAWEQPKKHQSLPQS